MFFVITLTPLKVSFQLEMIYDSFLPSSHPFRWEILLLTVHSAAVGQRGKTVKILDVSSTAGRFSASFLPVPGASALRWNYEGRGEKILQEETWFVEVHF